MDQTAGEENANSSIRNYELSRTTQRSESGTGQISYLTVSVILNQQRTPEAAAVGDGEGEGEGETPVEPAAYEDGDLTEIEALVKNAVGFQPDRGDRFAIHQTSFDTSVDEQIATEIRNQQENQQLQIYLRYGLMALALLAALFLLRSATRKMGSVDTSPIFVGSGMQSGGLNKGAPQRGANVNQLASHDDEEADVSVDDFYTSRLSPEAKARLKAKHLMFEEIKKEVNEKPENAAELLRGWISEDIRG